MNSTPPIIRFQVEHMAETIQHAIMLRSDSINEMISKAVKEYVTPENLQNLINQEVKQRTDEAISNSIRSYFSYGDGAKYIAERVWEKLGSELEKEKTNKRKKNKS